jgi:SOS-response transcriptional repressor LexA
MSYKIVMVLAMLKLLDLHGECNLDELTEEYARFYRDRLARGLSVDRFSCPYTLDSLDCVDEIKQSILRNPFEKFERKRFMSQCKDLNRVAFSGTLWPRVSNPVDLDRIRTQMFEDLVSYYEPLGGIPNADEWRVGLAPPKQRGPQLVESPPVELRYKRYVPYFDLAVAAGNFGLEQDLSDGCAGWLDLPNERLDTFVVRIEGRSLEPRIPDGSLALFRAGEALAGTRQGRIVLVQRAGIDPETGYSFTVKRYRSEKRASDDDGPIHTRIELQPLNPQFSPIVIEDAEEEEFRVVGEVLRVL